MEASPPKPRRRIWIWSLAALGVVGIAVAGILVAKNAGGNGKKKGEKDGPTASPVEVTEVRSGDITTYLQTTTSLEARNTAALVSERAGRVVAIPAEEGQWVQKGAVLVRLDDAEAKLAVERTEVTAEMTRREHERGQQLHKQGFLSEKELDDLELKQRSAKVELDQARHDLGETRIVAPFSGRVTDRMIQLGETVMAGKECFRLVDFDPLLARIYFPERELPRVQIGNPATLELDTHPGESFAARVGLVNPVMDRANGTFKVTLEVRDPKGRLRPGSFARVRLRTGKHERALIMPRRAVLTEDGEDYVFVAHGDTVVRRSIRLGAISGDTAQIIAGVAMGESVVTVGQGGLKQGSRIRVVKP